MGDTNALHDEHRDEAKDTGRKPRVSRDSGASDSRRHGLTYRVLVPCSNDKTGKEYKKGATVTVDDFPIAVIQEWLSMQPPVLAVKE